MLVNVEILIFLVCINDNTFNFVFRFAVKNVRLEDYLARELVPCDDISIFMNDFVRV
jgi:hypothetical protein